MNIRVFLIVCSTILGGCTLPPMDFVPAKVLATGTKIDAGIRDISITFANKEERLGGIDLAEVDNYEIAFRSSFEDALQEALIRSVVFNDMADRRVLLIAKIMKLETPRFGINFNTAFVVRYQLLDTSSGKLVFTKDIATQGSVPANYAFEGGYRYVEARNIAVRENILMFIDSLAEYE